MKILITGGCGFIGVNLTRYLLKRGDYEIYLLDNFSVGKKEFLEQAIRDLKNRQLVQIIEGDIRDKALCEEATKDKDCLVHLAAQAGVIPSVEDPFYDCEMNVVGTLNLLYASVQNKVKRFIFASSNAPLGEQDPPVNETLIPKPLSPYGASKLAGEAYCAAFFGSYDLRTIIFRFSNVYGPFCLHKSSVIAKFIKDALLKGYLTIYGDGKQTRDFIHVDDISQAILLAIEIEEKGDFWGEPFNLGTGVETSILDLAQMIKSLFKKDLSIKFAPERKGEIKRNYSDITKARKVLGFEPKIPLPQGVKEVYEWFLTQDLEEIKKAQVLSGSE